MGYTHYWRFFKVKGKIRDTEKKYLEAIDACKKAVLMYYKENKGTENSLSGYTAHDTKNKYSGIGFNGVKELSHEDFSLRETFKKNFEGYGEGFNFCKTAQKPYDVVVVACLSILKHFLGDAVDVSSDGFVDEWIDGVELAKKATGLKIDNPLGPTCHLKIVS